MKVVRLLLLLISFSAILITFYFVPRKIVIGDIVCISQYGPCSEDINLSLASHIGKNLLNAEKDVETTLKSQSIINDFSIQYKIPNKLVINIVEKKPQYAVLNKNTGDYYLIDKDGFVVRISKSNNLPWVTIKEFVVGIGDRIEEKIAFALDITYRLYSQYQIKETEMENEYLIAKSPEGINIVFPLEGDADVLMGGLQMIMSRLNESVKESKISISQIDLRFKNPVLK